MNCRKVPGITEHLPSRLPKNSRYRLSRKTLNKTRNNSVPETGSTGYFTRTTPGHNLIRTEYRRVGIRYDTGSSTRYCQTLSQYRSGTPTECSICGTGNLSGTIPPKHPVALASAPAIAPYLQGSNLNKQTYRSYDDLTGSIGLLIHQASLLTRPISQYSAYRSAP